MSRYYKSNTLDVDGYRLKRREWHSSLYATDVDLVEYVYDHTGTPKSVAYTEYKHVNAKPVDEEHGQLTVIATDAFRLRKPAFFVRWLDEPPSYFVYPVNAYALDFVEYAGAEMSEAAYCDFLMHLHGVDEPPDVELSEALPETFDVWPKDEPPFIE